LDILHLQKLLGHSGIRSTMEYLHLANVEKDIVSPLDRLYSAGDENA
jgi:site-specific recombinase XerD